jgi:hypothetical protein
VRFEPAKSAAIPTVTSENRSEVANA